jgi:hypothetical protein
MRILYFITVLCVPFFTYSNDIVGRWDLTVTTENGEVPSWLEVKLSGFKTYVGHFVGESGSARPISKIQVSGDKISFAIPPQWENTDNDLVLEGNISGNDLTGTIVHPSGKKYNFKGVRAPSMVREKPVQWGTPISLFNGKDLSGWKALGASNQWKVEKGVLVNPMPGVNLMTEQKFEDFKLNVEFRYPAESNSGIYLRGRYELQIEDGFGKEPSSVYFGGIYGFLSPNEMVAAKPGEWQSYEITLIGRRVTIKANGKTIICDQIIPGITGGALDSHEGEPGPILLQGDHGQVEFRNITITPAK